MEELYLDASNTFTVQSRVNRFAVGAMKKEIRRNGVEWVSSTSEDISLQKAPEGYIVVNGNKRLRAIIEELGGANVTAIVLSEVNSMSKSKPLIDVKKTLY